MFPAIQEFERSQGFRKTKNFRKESPLLRAYFRCYSTDILHLPDSYEGLRVTRGTEAGCRIDERSHDVFFYPAEALADSTKISSSLTEASDERKAVVVAHEDFHAVMEGQPGSIAEGATTLIGFLTAAEFAKAQFGEGSEQYRHLSQEAELFLRKAILINTYHARLKVLYSSVRKGGTSRTAALAEKQRVFEELGQKCREILPEPHSFNRCPSVLNNAGLAFDMTYANYYPAMYQLYVDHDRDLRATIESLKRLGSRGAVGQLKAAASSFEGPKQELQ
jgi:hypothetical protein